jgi:hypothetical protein
MTPLGKQEEHAEANVFSAINGAGLPIRTFTDQLALGHRNDRIELYYYRPRAYAVATRSWCFQRFARCMPATRIDDVAKTRNELLWNELK